MVCWLVGSEKQEAEIKSLKSRITELNHSLKEKEGDTINLKSSFEQ